MKELADDIVAILTESGTRTRRERAAFVAKLKKMGLSFREIGRQLNVTKQRAQQLHVLHSFFQTPQQESLEGETDGKVLTPIFNVQDLITGQG